MTKVKKQVFDLSKVALVFQNIFDFVFSWFFVFIVVAVLIVGVSINSIIGLYNQTAALDAPTTITTGTIVDMKDYTTGSGKSYCEMYYITYENVNDAGYKVQRTDKVTAVTYSNYKVGDFFDREGHTR